MYAIARQITSSLLSTIIVLCLITLSSALTIAEEVAPDLTESIGSELDQTDETEEQEEAKEDRIPELHQQERAFSTALASSVEEEEVLWLDIKYPGAASAFQSLALKIEAKAKNIHGAALIIPDTSQHADWPNQVRGLRQQLPYEGWLTLSVGLPWPELKTPPERELVVKSFSEFQTSEAITRATAAGSRAQKTKAPSEEEDAKLEAQDENESVDIDLKSPPKQEQMISPYEERALVHVQAAMDHLVQQGFQNIAVIALGESAELAVDYLQSREAEIKEKGFALILLEPKLPDRLNNRFAEALGNDFPAPVLDIFDSSSRNQSAAAKERKASARAGNFAEYQQLKLTSVIGAGSDKFLLKRIGDWLERYAPGQEKK